MIRAAVLGSPITHSLSPKLHGHWLRAYNINGDYTAIDTPAATLKETLKRLAGEGFAGFNLTLPLKEDALPLMDALDDSAKAAGAVNTVSIRQGHMTGYNSDGFGFVESLNAQCPTWRGDHVVLLGTGGAARGIASALKNAGAKKFTLVNRTPARAEALAQDLALPHAHVETWEQRAAALSDASLLVNCSSLGMKGQPSLDLDLTNLPKSATVSDIVYRPLVTPLLAHAQARGNATAEGLPMLLHQGRLGFKLWFGQDPAVTPELYNAIAEGIT